VNRDASLEGVIVAMGICLAGTLGDMICDHKYASLWITMFACAYVVLYVSMGAPLPWRKRRDES
jgi:hypothetical protein